jgi:hypothetical protein
MLFAFEQVQQLELRVKSNKNVTERLWFPQLKMLLSEEPLPMSEEIMRTCTSSVKAVEDPISFSNISVPVRSDNLLRYNQTGVMSGR